MILTATQHTLNKCTGTGLQMQLTHSHIVLGNT